MQTIVEQEFAANPWTYLRMVGEGTCIVISNDGHPVAIVLPMEEGREPRKFGMCEGEFSVPDDFNTPLPESVLQSFETDL